MPLRCVCSDDCVEGRSPAQLDVLPEADGFSGSEWGAHQRLRSRLTPQELVEHLQHTAALPEQVPCACQLASATPAVRSALATLVTDPTYNAFPYMRTVYRNLAVTAQGDAELADLVGRAPAAWVDGEILAELARRPQPSRQLRDALAVQVAARPLLLDQVLRSGAPDSLHSAALDAFSSALEALIDDVALAGPEFAAQSAAVGQGSAATLLETLGVSRTVPHDSVAAASARHIVLRRRQQLPGWLWLQAAGYLTAELWTLACLQRGEPAQQSGSQLRLWAAATASLHERASAEALPLLPDQPNPYGPPNKSANPSANAGGRKVPAGSPKVTASSSKQAAPAKAPASRGLGRGHGGWKVVHAAPTPTWESLLRLDGDPLLSQLRVSCITGDVAAALSALTAAGPLPESSGRDARHVARCRAVARVAAQLDACHVQSPAEQQQLWAAALPLCGSLSLVPLAVLPSSLRRRLWREAEQLSFTQTIDRDAAPALKDPARAPAAWLGTRLTPATDDAQLLWCLLERRLPTATKDAYRLALSMLESFDGTVQQLVDLCAATLAPPGTVAGSVNADTF